MKKLFILLPFLLASCAGLHSRFYVVEPGDSLADIASRYSISVNTLKEHNENRLAHGLQPGTSLFIPVGKNVAWDDASGAVSKAALKVRATASAAAAEEKDSAPMLSEAEVGPNFSWPVSGSISSPFGPRVKGYGPKRNQFHDGIDIAAKSGLLVKSARSGHVIYAGSQISGYGKMVIVRHADTFSTVYAHLSKIEVTKGQFVARGQKVGRVGRTGRATGSHLHFEVRNNRVPVNPLLYLQGQYATNKLLPR